LGVFPITVEGFAPVEEEQEGMIRILLTMPYHKLVGAIQELLEQEPDLQVVAKTHTAAETLRLVAALQPSIVVLDLDGYVFVGFEVLVTLVQTQPHIPVLVLGEEEFSAYIGRMRQAGAAGYLSSAELVDRLTATIKTIVARPAANQLY
jgi:DNA-binding NarL/FixJ family response regulator